MKTLKLTLLASLLSLPTLSAQEVQKVDIAFLGALIAPTKHDSRTWDATFGFKKVPTQNLASLLMPGVAQATIVQTILEGAPKGSVAPDVIGTIKQVGETSKGYESIASTPIGLATRLTVTRDSYTPVFTTEYQSWPIFKTTRFRIRLWDKDLSDNDAIGTVEITPDDIQKAIDAGTPVWINVADQSQNQLLYIQISAIKAKENGVQRVVGELWR